MSRTTIPLHQRLVHNPRVLAGAAVLGLLLLAALAAPWLSPFDPQAQDLLSPLLPPVWSAEAPPIVPGEPVHWLGTDNLGRDVLARLLWGSRTALLVAVCAALLTGLLGTVLGALAGYHGGALDAAVSRLVDVWMAFPPVLLAVVLVALMGTGLGAVVLAIVVVDWTRFARVVRAEAQAQRALDYVTAARMLGLRPAQILWREIGPNLWPLLTTLLTLEMGIAIVVEAILSFVGLSVASGAATWGGMIGEGRLYVNQAPTLMLLPMAATMLAVLGLNAPRRWGTPPPWRTLLNGVSFTLPAGGALGVIGESGSGKSTLARALTLLLPPQRGRLRFQGQAVAGLQGAALVAYRAQLQLVFQDPMSALNPRRTVGHSIAQPARALGRLAGRTPAALAAALLDRVGLPAAFASRYPHELSGGQRQRVNIARALALQPAALIADEVTSGLDVSAQARIVTLLDELRRELGLALVFISHDLGLVRSLCDDLLILRQGRVVEQGPAAQVFGAPAQAYTRALLQAIPLPDPDLAWLERD